MVSSIREFAMIRILLRSPSGLFGAFLTLLFVLIACLASIVAPHNPLEMSPAQRLKPPSFAHLMGTDRFGRDIFSRVLLGVRFSFMISLPSTLLASTSGTILGMVTGFIGGPIDYILMRIIDVLMAFPPIVLAILVIVFMSSNILSLIVTLGIIFTPQFVRLSRGNTLFLKEQEFVQSSIAQGATVLHILWKHILPNILPLTIAQASLVISTAILTEASLSFVGLGLPPPLPSLGTMIASDREFMLQAPLVVIFPGVILTLLVVGVNFLGDRLRDVLDPKLRGSRW